MAIFSKETSTHISDEVEINYHKMRDSGAPYPLPPTTEHGHHNHPVCHREGKHFTGIVNDVNA